MSNGHERVLNFGQAMQAVTEGLRVTRAEWGDRSVYLCMLNATLMIHLANGTLNTLTVSEGDILGKDYSVVQSEWVSTN